MQLGAFSISLSVNDLEISRHFYEKLGFEVSGGGQEQGYLILSNGLTVIGLFQGMFEGNILTFNPGLGQDKARLDGYTDIREIRQRLIEAGLQPEQDTAGERPEGPASFTLVDPDGNAILVDQFF